MDSKTTIPAASDLLATMFQNATIDKAENSEFSNSARDMFKLAVNNTFNFAKEGENLVLESSDVIDLMRNVAQSFLAEVRNNDQSRSTVGDTTCKYSSDLISQAATTAPHSSNPGEVDISDIVPPEPSSLPVTSIADMYTRSMLKCFRGYPLYNPNPFCELSTEYLRNGINVGDVGFIRGSGTFDFLFNVSPPQKGSINPPNLPDGFSLETRDHSATTVLEPFPPNTHLFQSPTAKTRSGEYICEGSEGAVLELPRGAVQSEATNTRPLSKLAARHGVQWYEYTMNRGRDIPNGSLYLITSVTKCAQWGIAVFDRPCDPGQGLRFDKKKPLPFGKSTSKYRWKGSDTFTTKISNPDQGDTANQCVFVRGYKIMIRQDIFDNLCSDQPRKSPSSSSKTGTTSGTRQPATRIRGGGGPDLVSRLTGAGLFSRTKSNEKVVLHPNFNSSLAHPSDLINAVLMSQVRQQFCNPGGQIEILAEPCQNPGAKVALTHDDVWCNLLRDDFPKLSYATMINVARIYTNTLENDCVSLEKTSDPRNVFEESSHHPLLGIENTAIQGPLTPQSSPDDDYTLVPGAISPTLPRELVERILLLLDTKSMLKCGLVNREFNAIIQSSTLVQYHLACKAAGVIDNPQSSLSYAERLEALRRQENAWRELKPVFEMTINVNNLPSTLYELTAGKYFLLDKSRQDLHYCHLPSSPQDNPQWFKLPGHGPLQSWSGSIVEIGTAVYEHDLVVNVISSEVGNQAGMQRHSLDLVLLKFSTGEYHPLARRPLIHVQRSPSAQPFISVKIVGDNIAFVVHDEEGSKLFIFDWRTGHRRLQHKATEDAYDWSVPVFVSPELLLVPNLILSCFEVWHLFPSPPNLSPPAQILSLKIPAISDNFSIMSIYCHGQPSPFLHSMPYSLPRPFSPSPENSIIIVKLLLRSLPQPRSYRLIMHRHALLDMIQKWTSPSLLEQQEHLPTWLTNEVTVDKLADPDDESVTLGAQSKLVSTMPHPGSSPRTCASPLLATSPTSHTSADSSPSGSSLTSQYNIFQVQWADWGPRISRWFQVNETHRGWMSHSTGQRIVFLDPNPRDTRKCMVRVADFNPYNVRRNAEMMAQLRGGEGDEKKEEDGEELEILEHDGEFSEDVYMGLKCVVHHAQDEYDFDVVLMDEERLLGLKRNNGEPRLESMKVLYFGS